MITQMKAGDLIFEGIDNYGEIRSRFNFSDLSLPFELRRALYNAFAALNGQNTTETQRQSWRCIRRFSKFINDACTTSVPLPASVLHDFRAWLVRMKLAGSTAQSYFNEVKRVLEWICSNVKGLLSPQTDFAVIGFVRQEPINSKPLKADQIKKILVACYLEIDNVVDRLKDTKRILAARELSDPENNFRKNFEELLVLGNGHIPNRKTLIVAGKRFVRFADQHGGVRALKRRVAVGARDVFPFYLAIIAQTSGNPMAIQEMERDCIRAHVLREDRKSVVWMKPRSSREQTVDFSVGRPRSAPNLI